MSTITPAVCGDVELARLLASAASCGWDGDPDVPAMAPRCEWPAALVRAVGDLPDRQRTALAVEAKALLAAFERPERAHALLMPLIERCHVTLSSRGIIATTGDASADIATTAAIGLIDLIASAGPEAAGICAWRACDQPLLRIGRHRTSVACSPRCANRIRVLRHRQNSSSCDPTASGGTIAVGQTMPRTSTT